MLIANAYCPGERHDMQIDYQHTSSAPKGRDTSAQIEQSLRGLGPDTRQMTTTPYKLRRARDTQIDMLPIRTHLVSPEGGEIHQPRLRGLGHESNNMGALKGRKRISRKACPSIQHEIFLGQALTGAFNGCLHTGTQR